MNLIRWLRSGGVGRRHATSAVINGKMTALKNSTKRADRYGNSVRDEVVLECSRKYPKAELYSVVPRGDKIKPKDKKEAATKVTAPTTKI